MTARHWLVVPDPDDTDDGARVEHGHGCPSMLVIDPWWADGPGQYETVHLCYPAHHEAEIGWGEFSNLPPGRHEIESWATSYQTNHGTGIEYDAGITLMDDPAVNADTPPTTGGTR